MLTEAYLEPSRTSMMELFSLQLSHILKTYLIRIALKFHFLHNSPFREKNLQLWKLREKKSFVNNGTFFFRNSKLRSGMAPSINRSSHRRCSIRKGLLRNFVKFTSARVWHRFFPVNFAKCLRIPFQQNTSGRLLLNKEDFLN